MAENNEPAQPETSGGRQPSQVPRRHISAERQGQGQTPPNELEDRLANLVDSVKVLAEHIGGEPATPADSGDRAGRRVKKFQRSGVVEDRLPSDPEGETPSALPTSPMVDQPPPVVAPVESGAAFNKNVAWHKPAPPFTAGAEAKARARKKRFRKASMLIALNVVGLCLLVGGFLAGRADAPEAATEEKSTALAPARSPDSGGSERVSERVLQVADTALGSARRGDADAARKVYQEALDQHLDLPGVHYQLARLAMQKGDMLEADLQLDRSTEAGEFVAAACYLRARVAGAKGNYAEVARQLSNAAHTDPFNGRYFFYWAEALRRRGETHKAAEMFERALDRPHTDAEGALYLFKQRLAKVEGGSDAEFNAELDAQLKQVPLPGEWALLAAAREIVRATQSAAAPFLKQAAATLPTQTFDLRVKDYLFQAAQDEPTLTALLRRPSPPEPPGTTPSFADPAFAAAELGDPAIWPTSTGRN